MSNGNAVVVNNIYKKFGDFTAVNGMNFAVHTGEIFSLLGPNGAGKSTTISILSGLLAPTAGDALIAGKSILKEGNETRKKIGVVPQDIALYLDLSARENLLFWGKMYGLRGKELNSRVDETLEMIGLKDRQHGKLGTFSGGMKRRVNIAAALLHKPSVVIMDEPTVGIDPQSRRHILDNVKLLNKQGMTVIYTTHYMEEAEELSNHIAIVDQGQVIAYGTHAELIRLVGEQTRLDLSVTGDLEAIKASWRMVAGVSKVTNLDGEVTVLVDDSNRVLPKLFEAAAPLGARITSVNIQEPNLETVFLHLTGKALRD